jgi:hypothetical protein
MEVTKEDFLTVIHPIRTPLPVIEKGAFLIGTQQKRIQ